MNEQFEEDRTFAETFDAKASAVQCAFGFEAAARTASTDRSDRGCQVESSHKAKQGKPVKCLFSVDGLCTRYDGARVEAAIRASPAGRQLRGISKCCNGCYMTFVKMMAEAEALLEAGVVAEVAESKPPPPPAVAAAAPLGAGWLPTSSPE